MTSNDNNNWRKKFEAMMTDKDFAAKAASVVGDTRIKNTELMNKSAENYPALSVGQQSKQPLDLSRVPQMQQEQAARATMGSNDEDYSGVVDLATKLYDEERTKRGQQALQNMQQPANAFASPMATAINRAAETNKAADISKTYEAVISNPSLQQAVRLNANKALVKALEANPSMTQEEQQKLYNETIDKQLQQMGEGIDKYLRGKNELKGGGEYVLRSAIQNSIIGKAMQTAIQSASGSEGELAYQQQALADYDANKAKWWEQGLGIAGGLVLDAPLMQGIGSAANATFGRATMWGLGKAGGKALQASTVGRIATGAAVSSGTLGGYNATSALANQLMEGRFDVGEIAASAGHGFMLGALTGGMSPWLRGVSAGMGKVGKVATMASGLTAEAGIFTASELSEMDNPYDLETIAQVFGKNVAVIGGLKVSNLPKTIKEYKQWYTEGKQSNFTDADYKTMADFAKANGYAADDAFTVSADGAYSRSVADRVTGNRTLLTMTKLQGGKEQNLAIEMYNDPNVPLSLKTKIAAKMNLPAPPPVLPNGVRVEGNKAITYYTMSNGQQQVIEVKEFDRPRKARAYANEFSRTTARRNDLLQSEASVNVMMSQPMVVARLNEQAKRNGTTLADEKARMDGILQRAADGTITQEDIAYYRSIVEDDVTTTESIKKDIKDKFGVEIDEVLNKEGNFTAAEDEALTAYGNALHTIIERGNPTTERTATAAMAGIEDYVALNNLGIEQTNAILANPEQRAAIEQQTRSHYAAWLKFFDGKMGEDALAQKLGLDLNNTSDLQTFIAEQAYFKTKAADRIAYNTAEAAKQLLERGDGGVRFLDDGRVKLKGVPFAVEVDESIAARYEAAKQGSGEPMQRIANDALKDIIKQSETPAEPKESIVEEMPDVEQPMTEAEAITQQMVDARLAEIDTDLQGIDADGVQRMTINGKPVAIIKGRIVADENGQVDKTKSSAEVAYMLLDENGRPILNEQGRAIIEVGVKPSNVRVENIEQWRSVNDYKASEEQRIRDNNRITDEAMRQVDEQTEVENQVPTEPKTADDLLAMCDGDKALALDVATDELAKAMQAKGKGATPAETIEINKRIRMYQQMVDRLSATEQPESAALPEAEQTETKAEPQVTEDMEFVYQQGLEENHDGMEPMQTTDGRYKWVGLQRGELTATMGERDVELLDNLAKKLGVAVIPINVADSAVNGYYRDGNIYVNTNRGAEWTMRWVAGHEMLHDVAKKSPDAYNAYKQAVLDMWGGDYIESQVKQIIEDYAKSGKTIDREQALTELVNDFGGDLFSSRDGLKILDNILKDQSSKGNVGFIDTIKKWWDNIKEFFGVSPYASEVEKKLADAYKSAMKVMADRMGERKVVEQQELVAIGGLKDEAVVDDAIDNEGAEMSIVRDRNKIDELEGEELVPMYRTFQVLDGRLYPPMATIQAGKKVHSITEGDWWKSDENPDLALVKVKGSRGEFYSKDDDRISKKGGQWVITIDGEDKPLSMNGKSLSYYFNLKKGEKGDVATDDLEAAYNPYIHTSKSALNDQFRGAYLRPNLVLVEVLVPKSEIDGTNRYKADYAKDGIGFVPWNEGQVIKQAVAAGHPGRDVALSRYAKIGRVFTNAEWADRIDEELAPYKDKITLPFITFPPEVLRGLANKGYKIEPPTSKKAQPYYEAWLKGEQPTDSNGGDKPTEDSEFSVKADKELEKKSLVGVHNLTEDNLRYALNLGGLANPSTAVIDKNIMGLEGFGDISLIMPKSLVAKSTGKNAGTFAGDAYTPRFPKSDVVKYITKEGEKAIRADYPGDDKFSKDFREAWQSYGNEYGGITPTLYYMYKLENGGAKIVKAEAPKIKSKEHQRMIDKFGNKEWYELNDAEKQELVDYRKSEMIESLKGADKNMVDKVVNDFINSADPEDLAYKKLRMLKMDYKEQQRAGEVDYMATYRNAQDDVALAGEQDKFNKWLADKSKRYGIEDRIFRGYTASGNRRYAPMTLANISKVMKEQGRAGEESFMSKSVYSLRAKMLPAFKTLESIRKNKDKITDEETYNKRREEISSEYNDLIFEIVKLPNVEYDDAHYVLEDALTKGFAYAEKTANTKFDDAVKARIAAFGKLLTEAPSKYFETKFERPVMFDEFVAAVVPKDINPELRKALTDNGLAIEEYERGSEESRLEAVRRASDRDDVQFSVKGKRADESVLDYAKRMSEENTQPLPTANAKQSKSNSQLSAARFDLFDNAEFSISKGNRATIEGWLNKRSDLSDKERGAVIDYIDKLDSAQVQLATGKWFANGAIRLPEDMPKVEQAAKVAKKAKVDMLKYASPMELINAHADLKIKGARINPHDVAELKSAHSIPEHGIEIFNVEDSKKGQQAMRKIINTHWGEDANPWCLLQGDGKGNLTKDSWEYWNNYNAYPKRVAFKDGKLLAFSANDSEDVIWWDRNDESHEYIPIVGKVPNDRYGRSALMEIHDDGQVDYSNYHIGSENKDGAYMRWSDDGELIQSGEYKDGKFTGWMQIGGYYKMYKGGESYYYDGSGYSDNYKMSDVNKLVYSKNISGSGISEYAVNDWGGNGRQNEYVDIREGKVISYRSKNVFFQENGIVESYRVDDGDVKKIVNRLKTGKKEVTKDDVTYFLDADGTIEKEIHKIPYRSFNVFVYRRPDGNVQHVETIDGRGKRTGWVRYFYTNDGIKRTEPLDKLYDNGYPYNKKDIPSDRVEFDKKWIDIDFVDSKELNLAIEKTIKNADKYIESRSKAIVDEVESKVSKVGNIEAEVEQMKKRDIDALNQKYADYSIKQPKDAEYEAKEQWRKDNAGAIASSFFADRRADKAAEVERLKKKISELKADNTEAASEDKAKVREIADEMHKYIKKNIPTENQGDMTRQQFESVLKQLEKAVTKQELEKPMQMVEYIGANVARRALTRQMRDFVKNGFKALTPKGLAKPKTVDGVTSRVLGLVKTLYQAMNKNAFGSDLYKLQKQVREEKAKLEQFNADNGGKYQDVVDKVNEILAKTGVDRYEELYKYFDEKQAAGDVDGEVLGYIGRMLPLLDSIELTKDQQKQAKADSAIVTKEDLDQLRTSLEEKRNKGILSEEDKAVLDNMPLYEAMLSLHQQQLNIDGPGASSLAMQMKAKVGEIKEYGKKLDELDNKNSKTAIAYKTQIKEANNALQELFAARIVDQKAVNANVGELLDNLKEIRDTGKSKLQEWSKAKQERATRLVKMANESFGKDARGYWTEINSKGKAKRDFINWMNNRKMQLLLSPAMSFEYMLGVMDPRYYTNDSPIYRQFIKSSEGLLKANDNFFEGTESYNNQVNDAIERFIGRNALTNLKEYFERGDRFATRTIPFEIKVDRNGVKEYITKKEEMTRGQAAKIYAWSRMADGMAKLKAHGVTDDTLKEVKAFIGEDYMNFIDWVEDEFFPRLRRERYNPVYKQMYGISIAENDHYFPFAIYQKDVRTEKELEAPDNDTLGGGVVGNLVERKRNNARLDFTAGSPDIFDMITDYGKKMEEWAAYAQVREDLKKVVNDKQFKQHCDELGTQYYKRFLNAAKVASRLDSESTMHDMDNSAFNKAMKAFASGAISLRVSTALKQLLSAPAFMVHSLDPAFQKELVNTVTPIDVESAIKGLYQLGKGNTAEAKKLLLNENWLGHYNWCVENLPSFRERVALGGAGNPILEQGSWGKFANTVQSVGMLPNRLVDAFTCSVGAKAVYNYSFNKYKKLHSEKTAHNMAVTDAEIAFNSSQQSSNPVFLSPLQVSRNPLWRGIMNYKNAAIGYYRNGMKANIDLYRASKALFGNPKFVINGQEVGFDGNERDAKSVAATAAVRSVMYNFVLNYIWKFGTIGIAGIPTAILLGKKDEDGNISYTEDEIKRAGADNFAWSLFDNATQGMPVISGFANAAKTGYDYGPIMIFNEINSYMKDIHNQGLLSTAVAQSLVDFGLQVGLGVNAEVYGQMYEGLQGIMSDRPLRPEDIMNIIASPRSAISGVTKERVGEYGRLRDYVNDRIASERQLGIDERMDITKVLTGKRALTEKSLNSYIDEYLESKIPGYREIANKPNESQQEELANAKKAANAKLSYAEKFNSSQLSGKNKKVSDDYHTNKSVKLFSKAVGIIRKMVAVGDYETAERIANEMERIIKRDYNPNGKTIEERLKNVDVWDSTGTTEQPSADGYNTAFERAIDGGFASYLRRGKD